MGYDGDRSRDFDAAWASVEASISPGVQAMFYKESSLAAAERIPDGSLDFVYIDAQHTYAEVLQDLHAWYTKVRFITQNFNHCRSGPLNGVRSQLRVGGLMAGDDYFNGFVPQAARTFSVRDAVDEFAGLRSLRVYSTLQDDCGGRCPNWYLLKCQ